MKRLKKNWLTPIVVLMILGAIGCSAGNTETTASPEPEANTEPEVQVDASVQQWDNSGALAEVRDILTRSRTDLVSTVSTNSGAPNIAILQATNKWSEQSVGTRQEKARSLAQTWETAARKHGMSNSVSIVIVDGSGNPLAAGTSESIADEITE